jgi:heat-inducible transcriptional repressor
MSQESQGCPSATRDRRILEDVIRTFIHTGSPVGSRAVAKIARHGLSAASIRNIMADLEESGYLYQPHTSAGRVPTAAGYHYYIDTLVPGRQLPENERQYIVANLRDVLTDVEELMSVVTHLLTEMTSQIGLVLAPTISETKIKAIHFLKLSGRRAVCILESAGGLVEQRIVKTGQSLSQEQLTRISNYLTESFSGQSLREIRDHLLTSMVDEEGQLDELLESAANLAQQALGIDDSPELLVEGTEVVITQPELADIDRVRKLLETFTDKVELLRMLDQLIAGGGRRVVIGEESDLTSSLNFSLVATTYGPPGKVLGALGIFGPSRMEYEKVVPLVDFLGRTVSETLVD